MSSIIFDPGIRPSYIVLVGTGGTGSHLARMVARMLYDMRSRGMDAPGAVFVDPDTVEPSNVGRQMFTPADIGRNKAELLATRFNRALGLEIAWRSAPLDREWFAGTGISGSRPGAANLIVLGAVDNHRARAEMAALGGVWIDCGNHYASGQVVIGNCGDWRRVFEPGSWREDDGRTRLLPHAGLLFPQLLEAEPALPDEAHVSCADLVERGTQHLLINHLMAAVAAHYLHRLLYRKDITACITFVDADTLSVQSVGISRETLTAYAARGEEVTGDG